MGWNEWNGGFSWICRKICDIEKQNSSEHISDRIFTHKSIGVYCFGLFQNIQLCRVSSQHRQNEQHLENKRQQMRIEGNYVFGWCCPQIYLMNRWWCYNFWELHVYHNICITKLLGLSSYFLYLHGFLSTIFTYITTVFSSIIDIFQCHFHV